MSTIVITHKPDYIDAHKIGMKIISKKRGKAWMALAVLAVGWFWFTTLVLVHNTTNILLSIIPILVTIVAYFYSADQAAKKVLKVVEKNGVPFTLEF